MAEAGTAPPDESQLPQEENQQKGEIKAIDPKPAGLVIAELLYFFVFVLVTIGHQYVNSNLIDNYTANKSIQQSLGRLNDLEQNVTDIDQFYIWLATFKQDYVEQEEESGLYKLISSPNYIVSDIRITTRFAKMKQNEMIPEMQQWVSTDFDPFADQFDEEVESTEPLEIWDRKKVQHTTENTYNGLGGFLLIFKMEEPLFPDFIDKFSQIYALINSEVAPSLVSIAAEVMFFNKSTYAFIPMVLKAQRSAAGLFEFHFDYKKPTGKRESSDLLPLMEMLDYVSLGMLALYIIAELVQYVWIIRQVQGEKKHKANLFSEKGENAQKEFEVHIQNIIVPLPDADDDVKEKNKLLKKFYWDELKLKTIKDGPSLKNGLQSFWRRDQRIAFYLVILFRIPVYIFNMQWITIYSDELQLDTAEFIDIVDRSRPWRQQRTDHSLINGLHDLEQTDTILKLFISAFTFIVLVRFIKQLADFSNSIAMKIDLLVEIVTFLMSFVVFLFFMIVAWASCQFILFGSRMESYSTLTKSMASTMILGLREFKNLDEMFEWRPNSTILLFVMFVFLIIYFLADIFISMVIIFYTRIVHKWSKKPLTKDEILKQEHWSLQLKASCAQRTKKCNFAAFADCLRRCCTKENRKLSNLELVEEVNLRKTQTIAANTHKNEVADPTDFITPRLAEEQKNARIEEDAEDEEELVTERSLTIQTAGQAYSDEDVHSDDPVEDEEKGDKSADGEKVELVKVRSVADEEGNSGAASFQRTPEEMKLLKQMNWIKEFEVYDLDADVNQDTKHTSNKQDAIMVKQREQRCGKVIWTTILQLVYMFLYLFLIVDRYSIQKMYVMNSDLKELLWNTPFTVIEGYAETPTQVRIEEQPTEDAFFGWIREIETTKLVSKTIPLFDEDSEFAKTPYNATIYFVQEESNYIVFQGVTICSSLYLQSFSDSERVLTQYTQPIVDIVTQPPYEFDPLALDGKGGYCMAFPIEDPDPNLSEELKEFTPSMKFRKIVDYIAKIENVPVEIETLTYNLILAEPVSDIITIIDIWYIKQPDGFREIYIDTKSNTVTIMISRIVLLGFFFVMFIFNVYIFLSSEHNLFQRYLKWYANNIEQLSKIEKDQRVRLKPRVFRIFKILFRPTSMVLLCHMILTIYTEGIYVLAFIEMTDLETKLAIYPSPSVQANLIVSVQSDPQATLKTRNEFQLENQAALHDLFMNFINYRRLAIINLMLVMALPLQSASQSLRFRSFLRALNATIYSSLELLLILLLMSLSILFMGQDFFGFESEDFSNASFSSMSICKMMIGRLVGQQYQQLAAISLWKAIIFILPIILMKAIFLTVFLSIVAHEYEQQVLNQDFSSNINIKNSICFCGISLDNKPKNKRSKMLQESEAMEQIGGGANGGDGDGDADAEEGEGGAQANGFKLGNTVQRDGAKPVNGGLEIYNKMDIKFQIQRKIQEWAMGVADEIKQEVANRGRLRMESITLAQKLFLKSDDVQEGAVASVQKQRSQELKLNSFNLMVARKDYIQYIWFGIQFLYFQGELIKKVIESTETEIKTLLKTQITKAEMAKLRAEYQATRGTQSAEFLKESTTLDLNEYIHSQVEEYLLILMEDVEESLQLSRGQWKTMQLHQKHKKALAALKSKDKLFNFKAQV